MTSHHQGRPVAKGRRWELPALPAALSSITTPIPLVSQHRTAVCHVLGGTNLLGLALVVVLV